MSDEREDRGGDNRATGPQGDRRGKHRKRDGAEGRPPRGEGRGRRGNPEWVPGAPFGPFGPMAGGPGGRGSRGGWRFEGGRGRASRGDVRLAVLALLSEGPRHGYQIIQDITERSGGAWAPSPGSIYPALSALQDEGLIDDEKVEGRKVFSLTTAGTTHVAERREQIDRVFAQNAPSSEHEAIAEFAGLMRGVAEAALTVMGTGTEAQRGAARELLARTRRDLFRILAEEPAASPHSPDTQTGEATEA